MSSDSVAFDSGDDFGDGDSSGCFELVLELCQERYRRVALGALVAQRRTLTRADLAKTIVKHDCQAPLNRISEGKLKEVHLLLHHDHIPKLEGTGLVEYDRKTRRVEPTELLDHVAPHVTDILEIDPDIDPPVEL